MSFLPKCWSLPDLKIVCSCGGGDADNDGDDDDNVEENSDADKTKSVFNLMGFTMEPGLSKR